MIQASNGENTMNDRIREIKGYIRDIPDFPEKGIIFKDITPLIGNAEALKIACDLMAEPFANAGITKVVGLESRGFIFGTPVAERLGAGFVPVRKPGKLPARTEKVSYSLEYGEDSIEIHADALSRDDTVLIVDDLLATGGTAAAAVELVKRLGARIAGLSLLIELDFLEGRKKLEGISINTLIHY